MNRNILKRNTIIFYKHFKGLEELKVKRNNLNEIVSNEENEKANLEKNIKSLQEKLTMLNNNLTYHRNLRDNYDQTIKDTETGFKKVFFFQITYIKFKFNQA